MSAGTQVEQAWTRVCAEGEIGREQGVAALIEGAQIAIFRTYDDQFFAVDNRDPWTGANVLSRGIVGNRGNRPTVASPLHKQVFDLSTGTCLDDATMSIVAYAVRVFDGVIEVAAQ